MDREHCLSTNLDANSFIYKDYKMTVFPDTVDNFYLQFSTVVMIEPIYSLFQLIHEEIRNTHDRLFARPYALEVMRKTY